MFERCHQRYVFLGILLGLLNLTPLKTLGVEIRNGQGPTKPLIVVIDAGHGGKDTGAIGPTGKFEKDVVLATARKLHALLQQDPRIRSIMVRKQDEYIDLRTRADTAKKSHADLFVSLHADAFESDEAEGASVFVLSETKASSEAARLIAEHENSKEVSQENIKHPNKVLASVLVDLSKNGTLEYSELAAEQIMNALSRTFPVHNRVVQKAGFLVLKSIDVPSVLVELAFISNPDQEANLCNAHYQDLIAKALFRGIQDYASPKSYQAISRQKSNPFSSFRQDPKATKTLPYRAKKP